MKRVTITIVVDTLTDEPIEDDIEAVKAEMLEQFKPDGHDVVRSSCDIKIEKV